MGQESRTGSPPQSNWPAGGKASEYPLTLSASTGGSVTANGQTIGADTWFPVNSVVSLAATPDSGWGFLRWEGTASGAAPLRLQWRKETNAIAQATNSTYIIPGVVPPDAGNYDVVVSNVYGAVTSSVAVLTVVVPPSVVVQPLSQVVAAGSMLSLNTNALDGYQVAVWNAYSAATSSVVQLLCCPACALLLPARRWFGARRRPCPSSRWGAGR